jgi:hypothetical protein
MTRQSALCAAVLEPPCPPPPPTHLDLKRLLTAAYANLERLTPDGVDTTPCTRTAAGMSTWVQQLLHLQAHMLYGQWAVLFIALLL